MNWGYRLMFTFIAFALMMGYLVYRAVGTNFELVAKDYYKEELLYQNIIDGKGRADLLSTRVMFNQSAKGINIQLPAEMKGRFESGKILFYCAYDSQKDKTLDLKVDSLGSQNIPIGIISAGTYTVKIDWFAEEKNFYTEKEITVF